MKLVELASFDAAHRELPWPWIAFDPTGKRFAFASADRRIETRVLAQGSLVEGPSFTVSDDLDLPKDGGVRAFAIDPRGELIALVGVVAVGPVLVTGTLDGEQLRSRLGDLVGPGFKAEAVAFDRSGAHLWVSAESATESAVLRVDARSHAVLGIVRSAAFPPPAMHELHLHPTEDAVLLLASCGEDGTFARVLRGPDLGDGNGDGIVRVPTSLDQEGASAGFVGFSADGARVHLAESEVLRTHAWPRLDELSSVAFGEDFVSNYTGAIVAERIFIDGEDTASGDDAVMVFEPAGIRGARAHLPVPSGMWAGRLGADAVVTVESKGDPAGGRVVRLS